MTGGARAANLGSSELAVERSERALDCPDDEALGRAVLGLGELPQESGEQLRIVVQVDHVGPRYSAKIAVSGHKQGLRELETSGDSCAPLASAVAVAIAVLLDLVPPEQVRPAEKPAPPAPAPRPKSAPPKKAVPESPRLRSSPSVRWGLAADAGGAWDLVGGGASALVGGELLLGGRVFELALGGIWATPRRVIVEPGSVHVSFWGGRLSGCGWFTQARMRFGPCAALWGVVLDGEGRDLPVNRSERRPWILAGAGLTIGGRLAPGWNASLAVWGLAAAHGEAFTVEDAGVPFKTRSFSAAIVGRIELWLL